VSLAALAAAQAVCGPQYVREKEKIVFGAFGVPSQFTIHCFWSLVFSLWCIGFWRISALALDSWFLILVSCALDLTPCQFTIHHCPLTVFG